MTMTEALLYGIPNCDQVRRARKWLEAHRIAYRFHDFRKDGLSASLIESWCKHVPWDSLVNRRGRTWRLMTDTQRRSIVDQTSAREALVAEPTLVKRPVLVHGSDVLVGFSEAVYERTLVPGAGLPNGRNDA
ncbi:MAG: ArsC family reductase [Burkholderiaceae bacterium]